MQVAPENSRGLFVSSFVKGKALLSWKGQNMGNHHKDIRTQHTQHLKYIAKVGILSAMAAVLMGLDFPLPFAPSFYQLDFSEVIVYIGSFALGPMAGVLIELLKNLLKIVVLGTNTAYVGELANFITGCVLVLPAALLYKYKRSFKTAVWGMVIGTVLLSAASVFLNYYLLIPTYSEMFHLPLETIIGMGQAINPKITDLASLIAFAVIPFNAFKGVVVGILTMLLYKRVAPILKK